MSSLTNPESMKIIIISPSLHTNHNISGISIITEFIIRNNTEYEYLHFHSGKKDFERRNILWFLRILKAYFRWSFLMMHSKDSLIHFNLALSTLSIIRDFPLIIISRLFRKRMVIHLHGGELLTHPKIPLAIRLILKYVILNRNPKIVLSPLEKEILQQRFNCKKIFVLPNCIDLLEAKKFKRAFPERGIPVILFLGRISLEKGIEYIYDALRILKSKGEQFRFVMAGKGPDEIQYVKKFRQLLGDDFEYKGVIFGENKIELLKSCNIFLLPSFFEGLPIALLETMAFGLVPITTDVGSIRYVVDNGINGIIVKKKSSEGIVQAIEKLSFDKEYMEELSKNAIQSTFDNYDPEKYIKALNEIYSQA